MLRARLFALLDWFVPTALAVRPEQLQQARTFLVSHVCGTPLGYLIMACIYRLDPAPGPAFWSVVGLLAGFHLYPPLLRLTGALRPLSLISSQHMTVLVLYAAYQYGGASSPLLPWLVVVPLN